MTETAFEKVFIVRYDGCVFEGEVLARRAKQVVVCTGGDNISVVKDAEAYATRALALTAGANDALNRGLALMQQAARLQQEATKPAET